MDNEREYNYQEWITGFTIFQRYQPDAKFAVSAEHDIVYAGPTPATVSNEDKAALERCGWYPDDDLETFYHRT